MNYGAEAGSDVSRVKTGYDYFNVNIGLAFATISSESRSEEKEGGSS
jgi:hypothetical protein